MVKNYCFGRSRLYGDQAQIFKKLPTDFSCSNWSCTGHFSRRHLCLSEFLISRPSSERYISDNNLYVIGNTDKRKIDDPALYRIAAITLAVFEAFATETYAMIFNPRILLGRSDAAWKTSRFNDTGIFLNAMSFEGRFTLGIFNISHRLSSIFIEQVSLGNFAIILTTFTSLFLEFYG